jgi:ribosomal protein L1
MKMGVDPRKSDQMVRGTCPLPHGSGKKVRVAVFAQGAAAEAAKAAGAEHVGYEDLIEKVKGGFSTSIAPSPHPMPWPKCASSARCSARAASCPTRRPAP